MHVLLKKTVCDTKNNEPRHGVFHGRLETAGPGSCRLVVRVERFSAFSHFENLHISVDQVCFYEVNSKKLATWAASAAIF